MKFGSVLSTAIYWTFYFLLYTLAIITAGGSLGAILFPMVGLLFRMDYAVPAMVKYGFQDMAFLAGVWAPATAIVLCVMKAHRRSKPSTVP